jgi:hypothetical protein
LVGSLAVTGDALDGVVLTKAVLDRGEQVVDLRVDAGKFAVDGGEFGLVGVPHPLDGGGDSADGFLDKVGALVGLHGRVEDGLLAWSAGSRSAAQASGPYRWRVKQV